MGSFFALLLRVQTRVCSYSERDLSIAFARCARMIGPIDRSTGGMNSGALLLGRCGCVGWIGSAAWLFRERMDDWMHADPT
jgi:hypothetical protein